MQKLPRSSDAISGAQKDEICSDADHSPSFFSRCARECESVGGRRPILVTGGVAVPLRFRSKALYKVFGK